MPHTKWCEVTYCRPAAHPEDELHLSEPRVIAADWAGVDTASWTVHRAQLGFEPPGYLLVTRDGAGTVTEVLCTKAHATELTVAFHELEVAAAAAAA